MEEEAHSIVIVGGGICGLATAIALHRKGIPSLVLEKSETLRADGVAIGIHANGWRALDQLGVAAELRETANRITAYHTVWLKGNNSTRIPVRDELRCLKRKDLIETLARNVPEGTIRFGCHIVAIHEDPGSHGAVITTGDGTVIRAKVLIGCDGTNSVVAKFLGLSVPKTLHQTVLRGFTRYPHGHQFEPEFLRLRDGDLFLGRLPVTDNLVYYFVTWPNPSTGVTKDPGATRDLALEKLQGCPAEITEMIKNSDPESLNVYTKIWYRPPWQVMLGTFQKGTVTVAGDAMHAMAPFIGQGGAAGLEDCVVLARSLSRAAATAATDGGSEPWEEAIAGYVRERRTRLALLSLETFAVGVLLRAKSPVTKLACFAVLALLGSQSLRHTNYDCGRL
ncbi:hypothetical protein ACP70R_040098 [Stipagrostis hirtigluma subsp. patula]